MKVSNDLIKESGVDKIIRGLIGILILIVCVMASVFLLRVSFLSILGGMVLGTVVVYLAGEWKESKDDVPNTTSIWATMRGAYLTVSMILLIWNTTWIIKLLF